MIPAAGAFAGLLVALLLSSLKPIIRIFAGIVVGMVVSGVLLMRGPAAPPPERQAFYDQPKLQETYEQAVLKTFPAYKTLADGEPEIWRETHGEIAEVLEIHGPDDPARKASLDAVFQRLNTKLLHGAAAASDPALLDYLTHEAALTKTLQGESVQQCAGEALGTGVDLTGLSPAATAAFHAMQTSLVAAYLDGGRTPVPPPAPERAQSLMRRAVDPGANPFSREDLDAFIDRARQPPDAVCALTLKFYGNVQAMPPADAAALLRTVLQTR